MCVCVCVCESVRLMPAKYIHSCLPSFFRFEQHCLIACMRAHSSEAGGPCIHARHTQVPTEMDARPLHIVHISAELAPIGKVRERYCCDFHMSAELAPIGKVRDRYCCDFHISAELAPIGMVRERYCCDFNCIKRRPRL